MEELDEKQLIARFGSDFYERLLRKLYETIINTDAFKHGTDKLVATTAVFYFKNDSIDIYAFCAAHIKREEGNPMIAFKMDKFILSKDEKELIDYMLDFCNEAKRVGMKPEFKKS